MTEAIDAAAAEQNPSRRSQLLMSIAKARAAAGRIDEAMQAAEHVTRASDQVEALVSIGTAHAKAGLVADALASFVEAMQIAHTLPYKNLASEGLVKIAGQLPD